MKRRLIATLLISLLLLTALCSTALATNNTEFTYSNAPNVNGFPFDFGDAPDPYPTLFSLSGAYHDIFPIPFCLGAIVDVEFDGQPDLNALGDDMNNDDEDGVIFGSPIQPDSSVSVNVTVTNLLQLQAFLNAWVDFNADGDWSDAGEQIFTDMPVIEGVYVLNFAVPSNASIGPTYARFRLSLVPSVPFWGPGDFGEVEDYMIEIEDLGSISGMKWNDADGNAQQDQGEPGIEGWEIMLTDAAGNVVIITTDADGNYTFGSLEAGTYYVSESPVVGWTQTYPAGSHTINLQPDENIENVDFGNKEEGNGPEPTVEVGGNIYPVNRLTILAPWISLATIAIAVAGVTLMLKQRRI